MEGGVPMNIDLRRHKTCVFGVQESGKTYWMKQHYKSFKKAIVYIVNLDDGWTKHKDLYVWQADMAQLDKDFELFIKQARQWAIEGKIDAIIIDEADLFFRSNWDIGGPFLDLVLNHRHRGPNGVGLCFLTRRPQDIPTKIVESSRHLIVFKLEGANAIERFRQIHVDLPALIEGLTYGPDSGSYDFVYKRLGAAPIVIKGTK
jgi:hypothetical protein